MTKDVIPRQLYLDIKFEESISLDNFINCKSTEILVGMLREFSEMKSVSNLHFLWGRRGVGKSYLMHAVNKECLSKGLTTAFVSLSDSRINSAEVFNDLSKLDIIFIEDIDEMINLPAWEVGLFNLINECNADKKKIIISSDRVAKDLTITLKDLASRVEAFTGLEVPEITEEEKIDALKQSAKRKGIVLEEKTISYILTYTSRNLSDLLKLLKELDEFSLEKKKKLSPSLVRELLSLRSSSPHT
jgi:DnaA family protein